MAPENNDGADQNQVQAENAGLVESLPIALAILLTFLLARIFQAGAEMRAELQETI